MVTVTLSWKDSKTIGRTMDETKGYHVRYLRAINNPLRRSILRALKEGKATIESLQSKTELDTKMLGWHLSILKNGFCVEKETRDNKIFFKLTQEGKVVDYIDK